MTYEPIVTQVVSQKRSRSRAQVVTVSSEKDASILADKMRLEGSYRYIHAQSLTPTGWRTFSSFVGADDDGGEALRRVVLTVAIVVAIGWAALMIISGWEGRYGLVAGQAAGFAATSLIIFLWFRR